MDLLSMSRLSETLFQNTDAKYRQWFAKEAKVDRNKVSDLWVLGDLDALREQLFGRKQVNT